jgi:hypothetical protein
MRNRRIVSIDGYTRNQYIDGYALTVLRSGLDSPQAARAESHGAHAEAAQTVWISIQVINASSQRQPLFSPEQLYASDGLQDEEPRHRQLTDAVAGGDLCLLNF